MVFHLNKSHVHHLLDVLQSLTSLSNIVEKHNSAKATNGNLPFLINGLPKKNLPSSFLFRKVDFINFYDDRMHLTCVKLGII